MRCWANARSRDASAGNHPLRDARCIVDGDLKFRWTVSGAIDHFGYTHGSDQFDGAYRQIGGEVGML